MAKSNTDIQVLFDLVPQDRQPTIKNSDLWICCPNTEHKNGQESTPSFRIKSQPFGSFFCFGCSIKGGIEELGRLLDFNTKSYVDQINTNIVNKRLTEDLLGEEVEEKSTDFKLAWDASKEWRGIQGDLLSNLNAMSIVSNSGTERMQMPVVVNKKQIGHINCALSDKSNLKYINKPGPWIKRVLFPYDYVKSMPEYKKYKILMLGEGLRDALNPIQYGFPTLVTLGGHTVWSQHKAELILRLQPKLIITAFDPDEVGIKLTELVRVALSKYCQMKKLNFKEKYIGNKKIKEDPGNMLLERIERLKQKLFV